MAQYELSLRDYLRIFTKRRFTILFTFLVVVFSTYFYLSNQPVWYQSSVTIKIEERKTIVGLLTEWIVYKPGNIMESEVKTIKSYAMLKKLAERLGILNEQSTLEQVHGAVTSLAGTISAEHLGGTNMIRLTVVRRNAKEARDLANLLVQVYTEENLASKAKQFTQAREFIQEQLTNVQGRIKDLEYRMKAFSSEVKNVQLAEPMQKKIMELEFQAAELLQKYTEKHPKVSALRDQIKNLEDQIKGFSGQDIEYSRMQRELEVNKKMYETLNEKLEEARISESQRVADVSVIEPAVIPGSPVSGNRRVGMMAGALLGLILGFSLAFIVETLDTSIGTIEDVESLVKLPVLGVVPSIDYELRQTKGIIAKIKKKYFAQQHRSINEDRYVRLISHYEPRSSIAEAYRNIHTNLRLGPQKKALLVTSAGPAEGKSSVVTNLAIVMAQTGLKTLLVSTDLRKPVLAKTFGVKKEPGLTEVVTKAVELDAALNNITDIIVGDLKFEDIRKTPGIENIWILSSGHIPANPVEILESKEIPGIIETLRSRFDVIIFDAPPVLPVTDASLLALKVDTVIIVHEIGKTSRDALLRTKIQLETVGAKISGIILNHINPQTEALTTYPYYSHYKYRYYGKPEEEAKNVNNGNNQKKKA